jgi:hypothetical protein
VDLPIENGDFPYSYVSLLEGINHINHQHPNLLAPKSSKIPWDLMTYTPDILDSHGLNRSRHQVHGAIFRCQL